MLLRYMIFIYFTIISFSCKKNASYENNNLNLSETITVTSLIKQYDSLLYIDGERAFLSIKNALEMAENLNYMNGIAQCSFKIAQFYESKQDYEKSIAFYNLAISNCRSKNHLIFKTYLQTRLVEVQYISGACDSIYADSVINNYNQMSLKHAIFINDSNQIANALYSIGINFNKKHQIDSAKKYFLQSAIIKDQGSTNNLWLSNAMNAIGSTFHRLNQYDSAINYYKKGIKLKNGQSNLLIASNLAECYFYTNLIDSAIFYYLKCEESSEIIMQDLHFKQYLLKQLSLCYEIKGDISNSYNIYKKRLVISDSIDSIDKIKEIYKLMTKYETNKKDQQILLTTSKLTSESLQKRIFLVSAISLASLIIIISVLFLQQKRLSQKKSLLQQSQIASLLSTQELKSINAMVEGQEDERKRIAEDLHDRVGSILSTVKLYFNSLNTKIDTFQGENNQQFEKANTLLDEAVDEIRRISHNLISSILMKFGLGPALKDLCETVEGAQQIKVDLQMHGIDQRLNNQLEISLYRIIQELISNMLKHAKATEITISITHQNGNLNILVEDNGKGFDTSVIPNGIGLKNIKSRILKLNGQINIDSVTDRGTIVNLNFIV